MYYKSSGLLLMLSWLYGCFRDRSQSGNYILDVCVVLFVLHPLTIPDRDAEEIVRTMWTNKGAIHFKITLAIVPNDGVK